MIVTTPVNDPGVPDGTNETYSGRAPTVTERPAANDTPRGGRNRLTSNHQRPVRRNNSGQQVHRRRPDEVRHERVGRAVEDLGGGADLPDLARLHDGHPVRHGQRLRLVVRHEDGRHTQFLLQLLQKRPGLQPKSGVQVRERFVEQEHRRLAGHRPGQRDPLLLPAGELPGPAFHQRIQPQPGPRLSSLHPALGLPQDRGSATDTRCCPRRPCAGTTRSPGTPWPRPACRAAGA